MTARPEWLTAPDLSIRRRYTGRDDRLPGAVARCRTAGDVASALLYAQRNGLDFAIRSSGHSYADHSSTTGLLIDVSALNAVELGPGTVTVGSGQALGELSNLLAPHGQLVPSGSCPTVAIGGITLAGGFGFRGRLHGLTADSLVRADIVLADGSLATVDADHDSDLFWALRGAGAGNFGVVTSLTLRTHPLTGLRACYASWPLEHAVAVLEVWQRWAPHLPGEATFEAYLVASDYDDEPALVELWGVSPGSEVFLEALALIRIPPERWDVFDLSARDAARYLSGWMIRANEKLWVPDGPFELPSHAYVKSEFFARPLPVETLAKLVEQFVAGREHGQYRDVEFTPWCGAYAQTGDSAFIHRDPLFLVSHTVLHGCNASADRLREASAWINASWAVPHPYGNGHVYQGYPDPELVDWPAAYYGSQLGRLREIKAKYDPGNLFRFAQSI